MKYIILFIPTILWGIMPLLVAGVKNSSVYNQITGTVIGSFIVGTCLILLVRPNFEINTFLWSILAGIGWTIGMIGQYQGYSRIGVSRTMPISIGLQLIGVPLVGVLAFGEWASTSAKIYGFIGIAILVIGMLLTSYTANMEKETFRTQMIAYLILLITTLGFILNSTVPKIVSGSSFLILFGSTIGMLIATFFYLLFTGQMQVLNDKISYKVIPAGVVFALGNSAYIYSVQENGVNLAFIISQVCVVISTIAGIVFLHEQRSKKGYIYTSIGLILIIVGATLTSIF